MSANPSERIPVPRNKDNDYTREAADLRRSFVEERTGTKLQHVSQYSFDPGRLPGNIENFTGVAQVPLGLAGPLRILGEHAHGDFYIPMATTEGTLVASYSRGMRLLTECGGVKATVVKHSMQRSPVFELADALEARTLGEWVEAHFEEIKQSAEGTTSVGKLTEIGRYILGPLLYLRFSYTTGDAAGQNMVGKATLAACEWIAKNHPGRPRFVLSGNIDTDKKHSQMNTIQTRGKRVVAEATVTNEALKRIMGVDAATLFHIRQISQAGAFMAGASNNGAHSANGLTALFISTGQDVANVAESQAAIIYAQITAAGDYYYSITIPSLIVATYGGGTGLATQRECLELLGCYGIGRADKLAEICAATALAGELSLSSAVARGDWVSSHDRLGRNRV
jgi:hydroxymethylglutaryl-CoA reductase (NADPH)